MKIDPVDLVIIPACLVVLWYAFQALRILVRDGWLHFRKNPHPHALCTICAPWARVGVDVQNDGRPLS